jgi:uncharacterized protein YjgD (DUF1641 family)
MSSLEGVQSEELEAAIAENPEAVAELVRRLDAVNELLDVLALGGGALDDEMVRSLAQTGSGLGELAQTAADEDTRDGLETLLDGVGTAERQDVDAVGVLGLIRGMRDPEVQHGLGYLLAVAKAIGQEQRPEQQRD